MFEFGTANYRKRAIFVLICFTLIGVIFYQNILNGNFVAKVVRSSSNSQEFRFLIKPKNISCNPPPSILIMIKSAIDEFDERYVIRNTWNPVALNLNMKVVFSIGYSDNTTINDKLSEEAKLYGDILQANFLETYHRLVLKTYWNMHWITMYCAKVRNVFFTDSDVIVFPNALLKVAKLLDHQNNTVVGHCWMSGAVPIRDNNSKSYMSKDAWPEDLYPPYCSGTGYFMTGDVPEKLLNVIPNGSDNWRWAQKLDHLEDVVFTGLLTSLAKVQLQHTNHIVYSKDAIHFDLCKGETISIHSFRPAQLFWKMYTNFTNYMKNNCSSSGKN